MPKSPPKLRTSPPLFKKIAPLTSNIHFQNTLSENENINILTYEYLYNGSGVATGDLNNDGLPDLFFAGNFVDDKLYLNLGNFVFKDISESAGILNNAFSTGVSMVDINADGWLDIYVCRSLNLDPKKRKNVLYLNNQDGTFSDQAEEFGIADPSFSNHASFFDYDNDGDLDMYLLNHRTDFKNALKIYPKSRRSEVDLEYFSDRLYQNDGQGQFRDITEKAGLLNYAFGLSATFSDLNNDGYLDIYVANDFLDKDHCYMNNRNGTFSDQIDTLFKYISNNSMGSDIADFNNDGWTDILVLDMAFDNNQRQKRLKGAQPTEKIELAAKHGYHYQFMQNMLHLNRGGSAFSEVAGFAGISNTDWSWAALFADFDLDGWQDLFITNGYRRDVTDLDFVKYESEKTTRKAGGLDKVKKMDLVSLIPQTKVSNFIFQNNQDLTFSKRNKAWGTEIPSFSNGAVYTDLDLDGDLDLVVNNIDDDAFLFKNTGNETQKKNRFLKIQLKGEHKNTFGIGAKVIIKSNEVIQVRELNPYRGYFSSVEPSLFFGTGNQSVIEEVTIHWPSGKVQIIKNVSTNQTLQLYEKDAQPSTTNLKKKVISDPSFTNNFCAYDLENPHYLLQKRIFQPKEVRTNLNQDGLEDIFKTGLKGIAPKLLLQQKNGSFSSFDPPFWKKESGYEDTDIKVFDLENDGDLDIYLASGGKSFRSGSMYNQDRIYINEDDQGHFVKANKRLPFIPQHTAFIRVSDFDRDGDLDILMVCHHPKMIQAEFSQCYILKNQNGYFEKTKLLNPYHFGKVTDALWQDLNKDDLQDLIIVGEWMPISIFINKGDHFEDNTEEWGLSKSNGFWQKIDTVDLDDDGDLDFSFRNRGQNSFYKASLEKPAILLLEDFDDDGIIDPIEFHYFPNGVAYPRESLDELSIRIPSIKKHFSSYQKFSEASLNTFTKLLKKVKPEIKLIYSFESAWLENLGTVQFQFHSCIK